MKCGGFQRIVTAHRHQSAAQKAERRHPIKEAQLVHGVGDIDRGFVRDGLFGGAARHGPAATQHGDVASSLHMARDDDGEKIRKITAQQIMSGKDGFILAGMGLRKKLAR